MSKPAKPADGCLFVGSTLCDRTEFVDIEFGSVRFSASVLSRCTFRVDGSRDDVIALRRKFTVGALAPLTIAHEHFGGAYLDELFMALESEKASHMEITFVHAEVMPP